MPSEVLCLLWWMQWDKLLGNTLQHHETNTNTRKYKKQYLKPKRKYHRMSSAKKKSNQKSTQVQQLTRILRTLAEPDKPSHSRVKGGKNSSEGFLERRGMTDSYYIATCWAIKSQTVAKWTQEENLKTNHEPRLQTDTQHKVSVCDQENTFSTLCQNRHHTN